MKHSIAALALVAGMAATVPACYGSYSGFHALHRWNGEVSHDKLARSAVHLGLWILPVYELMLLGDFLVFNTVEFATGSPVFH
ncbi:MAG: DUF3332 family protein [Kofleriaceae bacterium]|nr:DUF3332 family protein [Myxococcales bacterium]MCB9572025.1 DUF3332 family protein [Kofleriaceae bacterium]